MVRNEIFLPCENTSYCKEYYEEWKYRMFKSKHGLHNLEGRTSMLPSSLGPGLNHMQCEHVEEGKWDVTNWFPLVARNQNAQKVGLGCNSRAKVIVLICLGELTISGTRLYQ